MPRLHIVSVEGLRTVELAPRNSVGRQPGNTVQLLDRIVSKEHCIVEQRGESFWLKDLGSLNGTFINSQRVQGEQLLRHGDEISLGGTRMRFDDGRGAPSARGPDAPAVTIQDDSAVVATAQASGRLSVAQPQAAPPLVPVIQQVSPVAVAPAPREKSRTVIAVLPESVARANRIDVQDRARAIGTQITAAERGFVPFEKLLRDPILLRSDYERLRLGYELSREIALERDTATLLRKILESIFKFVRADRGVIFLCNNAGELVPEASLRRDGSETPISVSTTILNHVQQERAAVLTHDAALDFAASQGKSMVLNRISSAIVVPLLHKEDFLGVLWLDAETLAQFQPKDLDMVTGVAAQAALFIENHILAKKIEREIVTREQFARLLSPNIAQRVASGELEVKKGGVLVHECTVFNSDIRGFTQMSSGTPPETIVEMLNEYFELMVEILFKYEGTLDKFMGDGLMALWGAPVAHSDDPERAVCCALEQMENLARFNADRQGRGLPPLGIGIGIHTGPLVAGYIGSSKSLSYTVIGDTANTSARLCGHATQGQIIISEPTRSKLGSRFVCEELPPAVVKGKHAPIRVFSVVSTAPVVQVG